MNSYATTETEIMSLATMLVGTLSSLGVSESQILGLSAAMSSLGITAERGGSSLSKFFSQMASAASEGGDSLQDFADVAGVTGEAFASMFESDPMSALQAFIDGMVRLEGEGQSFVKTLDDMGIKEVRLRDTLLRLAGGHEILNSALIDSASAYGEATALQQEYDLMMQSTAAQWEVAKNKFVDVAIEIGGHLLPVIIDLLNQSDGLISMAQDVAQWFGNLDDSVKRNIVTWGAMAVPIGAVLTGFGSLISAGGSIVGLLGNISKGMGRLSLSMLEAFGFIKNVDGSAAATIGTLLKLNPAILGVVGALGLIGGGIWVWRDLTRDVREAKRALEDFPDISNITADQAESLRGVNDELVAINTGLSTLGDTADLSLLSGGLGTIANEIERINTQKIEDLTEGFATLPSNVQESLQGAFDETIAMLENQVTQAEVTMDRINQITSQGLDENGVLREEYVVEMKNLTDQMLEYYSYSLSENTDQQREIYEYLNRDITEMTYNELGKRVQYLAEAKDQETALYEEQQQVLFELRKSGAIDEQTFQEQSETVRRAHLSRMEQLDKEHIRTLVEQWDDLPQAMKEAYADMGIDEYEEYLQHVADMFGLTVAEVEAIMQEADLTLNVDGLIDSTQMADATLKEAATQWTTAVNKFSEATGKAFSDMTAEDIPQFIQSLRDAGVSWDELELLSKSADIDEDLKGFIQQVMETSSQWDFMTLEEKTAKIETEGEEAFNELMEKLGVEWETIQPKVHELMVEGRSATDAIALALMETGRWDELTLDEKMLLVDTLFADQNVVDSINLLEDWQKAELVEKYANVNIDTEEGRAAIEALLVQWGIIPDGETKNLWTDTNAPDTLGTLSSLAMYWLLSMIGLPSATLDAENNVTPAVETATGEVISFGEESGEAQLGANVEPVTSAVAEGVGAIQELDSTTADVQTSTNAEEGVTRPADTARMAVNNLDKSGASPVAKLVDYASATIQVVRDKLGALDGETANTYVYTHYKATGSMSRRKHGTPYHQGGMAILGDGGKHEPYLTPQGYFGVSPDFDTPVNLPMGSKVWSSINKFKQEAMGNDLLRPLVDQVPSLKANLPKYASGTDRSFLDALTKMQVPVQSEAVNNTTSNNETYNVNLTINNPQIREDNDIRLLAEEVDRIIGQRVKDKKRGIRR